MNIFTWISSKLWGGVPETHGIPNFRSVDAGNRIYRGGQPKDASSWAYLASLDVTRVLKLNTETEGSDRLGDRQGLFIVTFPITTEQQLGIVPMLDVNQAVGAILPGTFIHCGSDDRTRSQLDADFNLQGGQDRTGLVCACYRVRQMGWTKEQAEKEMLNNGFHKALHGLWEAWEHFAA